MYDEPKTPPPGLIGPGAAGLLHSVAASWGQDPEWTNRHVGRTVRSLRPPGRRPCASDARIAINVPSLGQGSSDNAQKQQPAVCSAHLNKDRTRRPISLSLPGVSPAGRISHLLWPERPSPGGLANPIEIHSVCATPHTEPLRRRVNIDEAGTGNPWIVSDTERRTAGVLTPRRSHPAIARPNLALNNAIDGRTSIFSYRVGASPYSVLAEADRPLAKVLNAVEHTGSGS